MTWWKPKTWFKKKILVIRIPYYTTGARIEVVDFDGKPLFVGTIMHMQLTSFATPYSSSSLYIEARDLTEGYTFNAS